MSFANMAFHPGLNVTVRVGDKWASLNPGDHIVMAAVDGSSVVTANVICVHVVAGDAFPATWLQFEHEPGARSPESFANTMDQIYGTGWRVSTLTAVFFWV